MEDFTNNIKDYISDEIQILSSLNIDSINNIMNAILNTYRKLANIYIFGNGGSAATASHFQNDFNKGISERLKKKFNFICLNDNIPTILAIANDWGYKHIYSYQLKNKLKKDDLVIGISGSGNSPNILEAIKYAKSCGVKTIGMSGYNGGKLEKTVDISFNINANNMQITEDAHMILNHLMMSVFMNTCLKLKKNADENNDIMFSDQRKT
jgi:D-sedoheptulose 7-phosphate isomerase